MFFICIVWGYDGLAGNVVVSIVQFRKDFGHPYNGDYVVDANWQLGFQGATMLSTLGNTCVVCIGHMLNWVIQV